MAEHEGDASPASSRVRTLLAGADPGLLRPSPLRHVNAGFWLPEEAFGASLDVDALLEEPRLTYQPDVISTLTLVPVRSADVTLTFTWGGEARRLSMEAHGAVPLAVADMATLERWMSATASRCHAYRLLVRDAADRVMWDAADGGDTSLPDSDERIAGQMVLTPLTTRVTGPDASWPCGVVELDDEPPGPIKRMRFVDSLTQRSLGTISLLASAESNELLETYEVDEGVADVTADDLVFWHQQVGLRELLYEDARAAYVYLLAGLEPPEYLSRLIADRNAR